MSRIVVYGGGALGLEAISYLKDLQLQDPSANERHELVGIIDEGVARVSDAEAIYGSSLSSWKSEDEVQWKPGDRILIAVGEPLVRYKLFKRLSAKKLEFFTLIHPSAYVASTATIGQGVLIAPFSFVGPFTNIGDNIVLNTYASAGHDCIIGCSSVLSPYAALNGSAKVGKATWELGLSADDLLGSGSIVLPSVTVGENSKVSAGCVLSRDVEANSLAAGNPVKSRVMFSGLDH